MISTHNFPILAYLEKNCLTDQTMNHIQERVNGSNLAFDVTEGYGTTNTGTSLAFISFGGFNNQKMEATLKFVAATPAGSEDIGVMIKCTSYDSPAQSYYIAKIDSGTAKIVKLLDDVSTELSTGAFALAQDELVTISFEHIGATLTANFVTAGASLQLQAEDSSIPFGGLCGLMSTSSTIYCTQFKCWQL